MSGTMRGRNAREEPGPKGYTKAPLSGLREAYFYVRSGDGQVIWYTDGEQAISAWYGAGGYDSSSALFCGRTTSSMTRVR